VNRARKRDTTYRAERETLALFEGGCDFGKIAVTRNVHIQTVQSLVSELVKRGEHSNTGVKVGWERLKPIKELLPEESPTEKFAASPLMSGGKPFTHRGGPASWSRAWR
jgi:hypothetical protein